MEQNQSNQKDFPKDLSADKKKEGILTSAVESQTAKVPSMGYLGLAVGAMALSAVTTLIFNKKELGNFFGMWAPSLLVVGVYNKLVKMESKFDRQMLH